LSTDGLGGGFVLARLGSFFFVANAFMLPSIWPFINMMFVTVLVILLCYFGLRLLGRVKGRGSAGGNLQLVESILVGSQNMVQLVRAGDKYLVIGVSKERVTLLAELDEEKIKEMEPLPPVGESFNKVLARFLPPKEGDSYPNEDDVDEQK